MKLPTSEKNGLQSVLVGTEELLAELRAGRPIVVVDDEDRENEGDIIIPAEKVTEQLMAFTIRHTGGVVCLAMSNEMADRLELAADGGTQHRAAQDSVHGGRSRPSAASRPASVPRTGQRRFARW